MGLSLTVRNTRMFMRLRCIPAAMRDEAMTVLKEALKSHPGDRAILLALVSFSRMAGDAEAALGYAEQLAVITPDDRSLAGLVLELRRAIKPSAQ